MFLLTVLTLCLAGGTPHSTLWYHKLIEWSGQVSPEDRAELDWLNACVGGGIPLTPHMESRLNQLSEMPLGLVRTASGFDTPDFEHDWENEGFNVLLDELGPMRTGANLLLKAACLKADQGNMPAAVDDILASIRTSKHLAAGEILINSMVAQSMVKHARVAAETLMGRGQLEANDAARLLAGFDRVHNDDPYMVNAALKREHVVAVGWISKTLQLDTLDDSDSPEPEVVASLLSVVGSDYHPPVISELTVGMLKRDIAQMSDAYDQFISLAKSPDQSTAIRLAKELEQATLEGRNGLMAQVMMPTLAKVLERRNEQVEEHRAFASVLAGIAAGTRLATKDSNAAWWWIRAGVLALPLGPQWFQNDSVASQIDSLLAAAKPMQSAQYPPPLQTYLYANIPWWLPGQDALVSGLCGRANQALQSGDAVTARTTIEQLARIDAALANDPHVASSLLSSAVTVALQPLSLKYIQAHLTDVNSRKDFDRMLRILPQRDPAGLQSAAAATRQHLNDIIEYSSPTKVELSTDYPDTAMLNVIAWLRGASDAQANPRVFITPQGDAALLSMTPIDSDMLEAWYDMGHDGDASFAFGELGPISLDQHQSRAAKAYEQMRAAARE